MRVKANFIEEKYQSTNTKTSPKFSGCDKQFDMFIDNLIFTFSRHAQLFFGHFNNIGHKLLSNISAKLNELKLSITCTSFQN